MLFCKVSQILLWCIAGQLSHFFGLLGNRTIKCRNTDMDQCTLLSHRHLLNIFHFFYSKCTSPVPHPDVFWYHLNSMCAQKNKPKKFCHVYIWKCIPTAISSTVDISEVLGCLLSKAHKNYFMDMCLMNS